MKTQSFKKYAGVLLAALLCAAVETQAQQRGGTGGFGGFGGFGGGGNRNNSSSSGSSSSQYNNNGTVGSAVVSVDPETHNIIVIADEQTSEQISNVLRNLDRPKPQVLIKVVFLEVQHNNSSDIGVEGGWGNNKAISSSAGDLFGLSGLNTVVTNFNAVGKQQSTPLSPGAGGSGGFYQIASSDFQATLRAIATAGKAEVLSRPSILARDGQLAKIVVGQDVPLPSGVSYATSGNSTIPIINVTYTEVGIILNVTPYIGADGNVEMILQPQISSVSTTESQALSADVSAPYIDIRSADTVVVTPDAQPVVIGGLIANTKSSNDSKVPLLGDIPLLGALFRSSNKNDEKTELLIFLTPHIVQAPGLLAAMSINEANQTRLITNSIPEQELDRYLERVPIKKK
jgi:general secretion pathway protein D